jgi:hypothetical protein
MKDTGAMPVADLEEAIGAKIDTSSLDKQDGAAATAASEPFVVTAEFLKGQREALMSDRAAALATVHQIEGAIQLCDALLKQIGDDGQQKG